MSCSNTPTYNLEIHRGDNKTFNFRYRADVPITIRNYHIELISKNSKLSKVAVIKNQTTNAGEFSFTFDPEDTLDNTSTRVKYEVVFWPNGLSNERSTKFIGTILLSGSRK